MHPWHDSYIDDAQLDTAFPVIIEIPKGSSNKHVLRQVRQFFEEYKVLENKQVIVEDMLGPQDAIRIIREALELYRRLRRGELGKAVK